MSYNLYFFIFIEILFFYVLIYRKNTLKKKFLHLISLFY